MLFSQRKGIKAVKAVMQIDSMDQDLRNSLWNVLCIFYWDKMKSNPEGYYFKKDIQNIKLVGLLHLLWDGYFRRPLDEIPQLWKKTLQEIRDYFFNCEWYEVFDFLEYITMNNQYDGKTKQDFMSHCNLFLKRDVSAYRFVNGKIAQITSEEEINEIEEALESSKSIKIIHSHLTRALALLSDRRSPDYRNSIKESISAIEAMCISIDGDNKVTLAKALKKIESKIKIHPALKIGFDKIYGYTSDDDGIRHSLTNEPNLDFEDAKFMMVACSAFVNYLKVKASKAGICLY